MDRLAAAFPELVADLAAKLRESGRSELAADLETCALHAASYDEDANAVYLHANSARELNVVELNVIGTRFGETICVDDNCYRNIDVDNFGRVTGVEVICPDEALKSALRRCSGDKTRRDGAEESDGADRDG